MPTFLYRARDLSTAPTSGVLIAETPRQAREELRARGLTIEELRPERAAASSPLAKLLPRSRYEARLVPVIRELATLTSAAIPLDEALTTVGSQQRGVLGRSLAAAFSD